MSGAAEAPRSQPGPGPRRGKVWPERRQVGTEDQPMTHAGAWAPGLWALGAHSQVVGHKPRCWPSTLGSECTEDQGWGHPDPRPMRSQHWLQESHERGWGSSSGHTVFRHGAGHGHRGFDQATAGMSTTILWREEL